LRELKSPITIFLPKSVPLPDSIPRRHDFDVQKSPLPFLRKTHVGKAKKVGLGARKIFMVYKFYKMRGNCEISGSIKNHTIIYNITNHDPLTV